MIASLPEFFRQGLSRDVLSPPRRTIVSTTALDPTPPSAPSTPPANTKAKSPRRPEKKYGPFAGGVGVAVWLNSVEDDAGTRYFRSISINL